MSRDGQLSRSTTLINSAFDRRRIDLQHERWKAEDNIDSWAKTLHFQIDEHTKEQKDLLQCFYNERQEVLNKKRNEAIDEIYKCNGEYSYDQMNNLLERCTTLKFELLVAFIYENQSISFIQCVTKEHLEQKMKNESSGTETKNSRSEKKLEVNSGTGATSHPHLQGDSRYDANFPSGQQTTNRPPTASQTPNISNRSTNGNDRQDPSIPSSADVIDKCPICFMIFPSMMKTPGRIQHVNEHYT